MNVGMTLPRLPRTLPKRTAQNVQPFHWTLRTICSANHLDAPMTLLGLIALSVEISTKRDTEDAHDASATFAVPRMFVSTASPGSDSSRCTCLCAAAWKTTSGLWAENTLKMRSRSL